MQDGNHDDDDVTGLLGTIRPEAAVGVCAKQGGGDDGGIKKKKSKMTGEAAAKIQSAQARASGGKGSRWEQSSPSRHLFVIDRATESRSQILMVMGSPCLWCLM